MLKFNSNKLKKLVVVNFFFKLFLPNKNKKTYPPIAIENTKSILIVGFYLIGDTIMFLPSLAVIRRNFINSKITLICNKQVELILKDQLLVDEFIVVDVNWIHKPYSLKNLKKFRETLSIVNKNDYDVSIDFRGDWRHIFFMNFVNAKRKVSFNFSGGEYMLTDVITTDPKIDKYADIWIDLLRQIGCEIYDSELPLLKLTKSNQIYLQSKSELLADKFIIGVHPGASQEIKKWDEHKYTELIGRLNELNGNARFFIFEGPNEEGTIKIIKENLELIGVDFIIIKENIPNYIALISSCDIMICNDSGAAHIAAAFGIPTIVVFGNVNPKYVEPIGSRDLRIISHEMECKPCHASFCKYNHNLCIKGIGVDEVYSSAKDVYYNLMP
ncbi:ADP-heptose:LPS heptosyltransferase [Pedobacter sp. AK013]|uniref:glycosyltransferase family 9 protein n=1 Tax=Pedobacter sp. AK013 TaxID=2723071 RepID=UPI00161D8D83|nr:glycosyltransferase family 9 protein [Pedobacter sp. AK013]MBB6240095.1 ADP-heptose:LPS heptosyltransferase [Pedobacter sp. AK013]